MAVVVACVGRAAGGPGAHAPGAGGPRSRGLQDQRCGRRAAVLRRVARVTRSSSRGWPARPCSSASTSARRSSSSRGCRRCGRPAVAHRVCDRPTWRRSRRILMPVASSPTAPPARTCGRVGAAHERSGRQCRGVRAGGGRSLPRRPTRPTCRCRRGCITPASPCATRPRRTRSTGRSWTRRDWRGGGDPARTSWVNMRVPDGTDYVEYMLNDKPPTRQQLGSQHHACLLVPDIQAAWESVRARTPPAARAACRSHGSGATTNGS